MGAMRKLGKLTPRQDRRTLRLNKYMMATLPEPPATVDLAAGSPPWGLFANDRAGDCTCATAGNFLIEWTSLANRLFVPTDTQILKAYSDISGYNPTTGDNDDGAAELDVLKYWRNTGIAGHRITAFGAVDTTNIKMVKQACYLFEGLYIGVSLPVSAQDQTVWDVADPELRGTSRPGSWGGHAVPIVGYDEQGLTCVTWGGLQKMSWAFFESYCDEAYAIVSVDQLLTSGKAPLGIDLQGLWKDLAIVTGQSVPPVMLPAGKKALVIGGNWMIAPDELGNGGDGDAYWALKELLLKAGYDQVILRAWNKVTMADLNGVMTIVCYSYGCAEVWQLMKKLQDQNQLPPMVQLIIVAGVPNGPDFGQFYGSLWHAWSNFQYAVAFNVTAIPASCSLQNSGAVNIDIHELNLEQVPDNKYVNINCDSAVNWFRRHEMVKDTPAVLAGVVAFAKRALLKAA